MMKKVTIYCKNTSSYHDFPIGTSLTDIKEELRIELTYPVVAARVNYKVEDLNFLVYKPKDIEFIDMSISSGMRVYVRTLSMVLAKAVDTVFPDLSIRIEHPISKGYYCSIKNAVSPIPLEMIEKIKQEMIRIIRADEPIISDEAQIQEVHQMFKKQKHTEDQLSLFETLNTLYCRYVRLGEFVDFYNGVLLPRTGMLSQFDLIPYYDGLLLKVPNRNKPDVLEDFKYMPKMYEIFKEFVSWNKIMKMENIGDFNVACRNKKSFELIKVAEALHEKKVASIADKITQRDEKVRIVLISGPSSSGKTTFSKRLSVQLMVNRRVPVSISLDNYFLNRDLTPRDENGEYDFEHIEAMDLEFFNKQMRQLLDGEEIELPTFNFETGKREFKGNTLKLHKDTILILEGIHALNPRLLPEIENKHLFKIYVSALTTISIDDHNWIPTADTRLIRRIVRDHKYRSYSARDTIARWDSVRKGEEKWIFPFQEEADVMFNSALIFELAVLKKYVEPILAEVPKFCDEYTETHRLLKFLNFFVSIPDKEIPPTSLLREFLGGSSFRY